MLFCLLLEVGLKLILLIGSVIEVVLQALLFLLKVSDSCLKVVSLLNGHMD